MGVQMADMDSLLGSRISLISLQDVRYDGVLYSINQKESSIVLRDVRCLGTEDRVVDLNRKVPSNPNSMPFVSFPGNDIKDLFVHDNHEETPSPPVAPNAVAAFGNSLHPSVPDAAPVSHTQQQPSLPLEKIQQPHMQHSSSNPAQSKSINIAPTNTISNAVTNATNAASCKRK